MTHFGLFMSRKLHAEVFRKFGDVRSVFLACSQNTPVPYLDCLRAHVSRVGWRQDNRQEHQVPIIRWLRHQLPYIGTFYDRVHQRKPNCE